MPIFVSGDGETSEFPLWHSNVPPVAIAVVGESVAILSPFPPIVSVTVATDFPRLLVLDPNDGPVLRLPRSADTEDSVQRVTVGQALDPAPVRVELDQPGRLNLTVHTADGAATLVTIVFCDAQCLDYLPAKQRSGGSDVDKRSVLRSVARHYEAFAGEVYELHGKPISSHGA